MRISWFFAIIIVFLFWFRDLLLFMVCLRSSKAFEKGILNTLLHAPISYFDSTKTGRITNRFSRDLTIIDIELPTFLELFAMRLVLFLSLIVFLAIILPWYLIVVIPSIIIMVKLRNVYLLSSRELKRIESITRSPIYNIFNECVFGLETIRSYKLQQYFINKLEDQINTNARPSFDLVLINRYLGVLLEILITIQTLFITLFILSLKDTLAPNIAALCITYATQFGGSFNFMVCISILVRSITYTLSDLYTFRSKLLLT